MPIPPPPAGPAVAVVRAASPATPPRTGVVQDSAGRPLANVNVALPALQRQTTTNEQGAFTFRGLPAGTYVVNAFQVGFALARATAVVPQAGAEVRVRLVLRPTTIRLETVQVTATPVGTDPLQITQSTLDLSGRALERNLGASVATTLANEPGISQRFSGPVANMPVIRGLTGERILVLQDGQRAGDLSGASSDHAVTIDPLSAQRIEVVRGPASLLYGTQALGGVVNVISNDIPTQVPTHVQGSFAAQGESVSPGGAGSLTVTAPLTPHLALLARGTVRSAEDFRVGGGQGAFFNTFQRTQGGVAGLGFAGDRATGGVVYRGNRFDYGLPAPAGDADAGTHIRGARNEAAGRADVRLGGGPFRLLRVDGNARW
jgi:iron complex outermembrane receptor protein